jgi:hypothetical protein
LLDQLKAAEEIRMGWLEEAIFSITLDAERRITRQGIEQNKKIPVILLPVLELSDLVPVTFQGFLA